MRTLKPNARSKKGNRRMSSRHWVIVLVGIIILGARSKWVVTATFRPH